MAISSDLAGVFQLILAQQEAEARKEERHQQTALTLLNMEMREKAADIAASKELYNENKKLYYNALDNLQNLEHTYGETVGSLEPLNELYKSSGKELAVDIYKGEATDYQGRADQALENWQAVQGKIGVLKSSLYGDVKRAKNIMAGGASYEGGILPEEWDIGDLGLVAYEAKFGKSSPTVKAMFENNPGLMTTSLANLQKTQESLFLTKDKRTYYDDKGQLEGDKRARDEAELTFGTLSHTAAITSGKQQYDGLLAIEANLIGQTDPDELQIAEYQDQRNKLRTDIGREFALLLGDDVKEEDYFDYSQDYIEMHDLSKGASQVRQGRVSYGNWSIYNNYVQQAKDSYLKAMRKNDTEKASMLNELATKYFGMPEGMVLSTFALDMSNIFADTILSKFEKGNQINEEEAPTNLILDDVEDNEWEGLLRD